MYEELLSHGLHVDRDPYCRYDNLATVDDLTALYEVLQSVKDKNGRNAVLTANAVVANPVFDKIKESGYTEYFYEPFTETLKRYPSHEGVYEMWKQGIAAGIFHPQFHGREHLNVKKWLRTLQAGDEVTRLSFDLGTFGLTSIVDSRINNNYMGAFNSGLDEDIPEYDTIITEGLQLFENLFGYKSESFIATTYTWNPKIEPILYRKGIRYLQGLVHQRIPKGDDKDFIYKKNNYQGKKNGIGQYYLMRNAFFEPTHFRDKEDVVNNCLGRIATAFKWGKAAVISSHRINYIGNIDVENRDKNLLLLKQLLNSIVQQWPDVSFVSSDELGQLIESHYDKKQR
ncbi:hypothetical protein [Prevotella sp. E13-27]|uniref:hypothetical protein n=1 Tax=Prevotella sp. E13-27 TaxID=2938122 RepID=UPI00200B8638|nr:hypothetical protein [Prevotella sp. E13-27]MCK8623643.1 hypothetical protein [Prevotella sp. E13-27]